MTIYALASAPGRAAIAVIRLSGPACAGAVRTLTGAELPPPRRASLRHLFDPATGESLDSGLVLWFPGPESYTGEDSAELHVHGGRAVVQGVLDALADLPGLRPAEAGEFSKRAVVHGRLDLTQAEAVADLVDADTGTQRRQALAQLDGALGAVYEGWASSLTGLLARLEAAIDFPDEDLPADVLTGIEQGIKALAESMSVHLADDRRGERLRDGFLVAILGAPNVGKSSLLNCLARRDAAIVSEEAGTTRDVVEVAMDVAGFDVVLADTAGLRESSSAIEVEGMRRARDRAAAADLKLIVVDAGRLPDVDTETLDLIDKTSIVVANKCDVAAVAAGTCIKDNRLQAISCTTGAGLDDLVAGLEQQLRARWPDTGGIGPTRARHRAGVTVALAALDRARAADLPELLSEDLRVALRAIGRITGRVDVEELLDVVFRDFCIGK